MVPWCADGRYRFATLNPKPLNPNPKRVIDQILPLAETMAGSARDLSRCWTRSGLMLASGDCLLDNWHCRHHQQPPEDDTQEAEAARA